MMTSPTTAAQNLSSAARAEAAAWIARLHGPQRSSELEAGFRRWLEADPQNAQAFEGMTEIWDAVGGARAGRFPRVNTCKPPDKRQSWARAAAVLLICGIGGLAAYTFWDDPTYVTAIGEQRRIDLDDGSYISLNSNTRLVVLYRNTARRIQLEEGEAFFEVAPNSRRPFVVVAGDHEVTALGTAFVVRQEPDRTAVTLVEGKVTVAPVGINLTQGQNLQAARILHPGERITISAKRTEQLDSPPVDSLVAWRRGEVMLDHTPLAQAAAEMNRYDTDAIVIDDPAIAALRISGNYKIGDSAGFARAIANMYGFKIAEREGRIHLHE